jgi:hypothetical protein
MVTRPLACNFFLFYFLEMKSTNAMVKSLAKVCQIMIFYFSRIQSPGKTLITSPHFKDGTQGKP